MNYLSCQYVIISKISLQNKKKDWTELYSNSSILRKSAASRVRISGGGGGLRIEDMTLLTSGDKNKTVFRGELLEKKEFVLWRE